MSIAFDRTRTALVGVVLGFAGTTTLLVPAVLAADAKQPAAKPAAERPALGDIDVGDYCTLLLAPKLRTYLGCSDAQREKLTEMTTRLKTIMDNCATAQMPGDPMRITPGLISARIKNQLGEFGRKVRDLLTPEQDRRLVDMFNAGTLKPIEVSAVIDTEAPRFGPGAGKVYRTTSYRVDYTHYGEKTQDGGNGGANPPALPKSNAVPPPEMNTRPKHGHVRPGKADTGGPPVAATLTDPLACGRVMRLPTRDPVHHIAVSANGKMMATAEDRAVRLWDCSGTNPADVMELEADQMHLGRVRAVALSPDGSMLAVGCDDKSVRLFAIGETDFKRLDAQLGHDSGLWNVAFSPDGKSLISAADDMQVICWNLNAGRLEEKSRIKIQSIFGIKYLAIQPGPVVTCTSGSGDVNVIDFSGSQPAVKDSYKLKSSAFALPMAMSPADSTLLFGGGNDIVLKGAKSQSFTADVKDIKGVAWSPDGKFFAIGTDDGHLMVLDTAGQIRFDYPRPTRFNEVAFLPPSDGSKDLIVAGANENAEVYLLRLKASATTSAKK
ncbi:MAG TPA: hypothetical protein VLJ39_18975 [Tepidisphaeraceae bacterium]|nr:hypothetical protein [Tepidisphaeraceae bacterium]